MANKRYTLTYFPEVKISFDSKGNLLEHDLKLNASDLADMIDLATNKVVYTTEEAEQQIGKIIYQSIVERLDTLAVTEFYYNPDDEPF
jgi:hypothetical protein